MPFYSVKIRRMSRKEGYFMHMADALVSPAVAGAMYAASTAAAAYSRSEERRVGKECL